jgi:hypothetical protein
VRTRPKRSVPLRCTGVARQIVERADAIYAHVGALGEGVLPCEFEIRKHVPSVKRVSSPLDLSFSRAYCLNNSSIR